MYNHHREYPETCGIIYCATQSDTVEMAFVLKQHGVTATFYHAGVESGDRMRNASLWLSNNVNVMCCTNAFGMGIDKKMYGLSCICQCLHHLKIMYKNQEGVVMMARTVLVHYCSALKTEHFISATYPDWL